MAGIYFLLKHGKSTIFSSDLHMSIDRNFRKSTDEVTPSMFAAHGRVEMFFEGDILQYEACGPFNKELFESLAVAQLDFLKTANHQGPWASICLVQRSGLTSPEGFLCYEEMIRAPKPDQFTPLATAFVVPPGVEGGSLMLPRVTAIFARVGRPFKGFDNMSSAKDWANSLIDAEKTRILSKA